MERDDHRQGLARFADPRYRARFRESLSSPGRLAKLRAELWHFDRHLDRRFAQEVRNDRDEVRRRLEDAGARDGCFLLTADGHHDKVPLTLDHAVALLLEAGGGFLSAVPGRLALYVSEEPSDVYLLRRPD